MTERFVILEGAERDQVLERAGAAGGPADIARQVMDTPWGRRACRVAALVDEQGEPVAWATVQDLPFRLEARRLTLGGVGALHVGPELRAMGLDRFFLVRVEEWLRGRDADGVLLFADAAPKALRRLGWLELPQGAVVADLRVRETAGPDAPHRGTPRPYEARDFDQVRELWNLGASLRPFSLLREAEWWDAELLRGRLEAEAAAHPHPWGFLVAEHEGRVLAYLRSERRGERTPLRVLEFAHDPGAREEITGLLRFLLARLGPDAPRTLAGVTHSRLANLCPSDRVSWHRDLEDRLLIKAFGSFTPPIEMHPDDRIVWPGDRALG